VHAENDLFFSISNNKGTLIPLDVVVGGADEGEEVLDRVLPKHPDAGIPEADLVEDRVDS